MFCYPYEILLPREEKENQITPKENQMAYEYTHLAPNQKVQQSDQAKDVSIDRYTIQRMK